MATAIPASRRTEVANPADLPRGTLVQLLYDAGDRFVEEQVFRYKHGGEWHSISFGEFLERVRLLGLALQALGIERGDRVALLSENCPEWVLSDFAVQCIGAITVPIYPNLPSEQISFLLQDSGARAILISTPEQRDKVLQVRTEAPELKNLIVFEGVSSENRDRLTLTQAIELGSRELADGKGEDFRQQALRAEPDDVATVLYTSGTTGPPKGVMLTHQNVFSNVMACRELVETGAGDTALSMLPLSHILERMTLCVFLQSGVTVAFAESIQKVPENLVEVRPTIVVSVPRLYEKIHAKVMSASGIRRVLVGWAASVGNRYAEARLEGRKPGSGTRLQYALADRLVFAKLRARTGGRIRYFLSGAAPLNPEVAKFFYAAGMPILEGYGLTESSPVLTFNAVDEIRLGTVGRPVPGTEIRIAEDGEILARGPQVMKGYFQNPEATRDAMTGDGFLRTGDIGELDADGYLRITDRKKELLVTAGGKNIAPAPIEQRAKTNAFVDVAVMLGDGRPFPLLLVIPDFEALQAWARSEGVSAPDRASLIRDSRVQEKMEREVLGSVADFAGYERPKKVGLIAEEFTVDSGELTPTLKVKRRVVEEKYSAALEELYASEPGDDVAAVEPQ